MSSQTPTPERETTNTQIKTCADCGTTKTPLWRGGPAGPKVRHFTKSSHFSFLHFCFTDFVKKCSLYAMPVGFGAGKGVELFWVSTKTTKNQRNRPPELPPSSAAAATRTLAAARATVAAAAAGGAGGFHRPPVAGDSCRLAGKWRCRNRDRSRRGGRWGK